MNDVASRAVLVVTALVVLRGGADTTREAPVFADTRQVRTVPDGPSLGERRFDHSATLLADGRILVAGGTSGSVAVGSAFLLNPVSRAASATGSLLTPRGRHMATRLKDGRVLIVGGHSPSGTTSPPTALNSAEIYDPASGLFTSTGSMTSARVSHAAVLLADGRVLVCAGYGGNLPTGAIAVHATAELFDPATGRFTAAGGMTATRTHPSATLHETGQVLVTSNGTAELYDPATNRFASTGNPVVPRNEHTATLLGDGQVLIVGGLSRNESVATAERYDPRAGVFRPTGSLTTARSGHTATLMDDGRVLVAGGQIVRMIPEGRNPYTMTTTATAEIYDPIAGTFGAARSMAAARGRHAAVLTPGGVWIIGGVGATMLNSSEFLSTGVPDSRSAEASGVGNRTDTPPPANMPRGEERLYSGQAHAWSISYPQSWSLDDRDPDFVKITQAAGLPGALVAVHFALFDHEGVALDTFANRLMAAERQRPGFRILSRTTTTLPDGTVALEVVNVLGTGTVGKSRKRFAIVGHRGFCVNAETHLDSWPALDAVFDRMISSFSVSAPTWQERMEDARRLAKGASEYTLATPSGVFVFYNNPQPFCYMYAIPGDWVAAPEPSAHRSRDGNAFVGVLFRLRRELEGLPGKTLAERALNDITRRNQEAVGHTLTVRIVPFKSSRSGAWEWTAASIAQRDRDLTLPRKIVVDIGSAGVAEITVIGTPDDAALARAIVDRLSTTSDRQCYWSTLESMLKGER